LEFAPRKAVIAWANQVLNRYPERQAIIATYAYLFRDNTRFDHTKGRQRANPHGYGGDGNDGEELSQNLVTCHANVMLVVCGHVRTGGVAYLASQGQNGNTVHQILNDHEAIHGNGRGFLRLLEFLPDGRGVQVKAYSPVLDKYLTDPQNQFSFILKPAAPLRARPGPINPRKLRGSAQGTAAGTAFRRARGRSWPVCHQGKCREPVWGGLAAGERLRATGFF
jgi:hypothetical protein